MRVQFGFVLAAASLVLAGCNGPKSDCEGTYKSYCNTLEGQDWDGMYELLTPEFKKKVHSAKGLERGLSGTWKGTKSFTFKTINVNETKAGVCTVQGEMSWTTKIRGELPYDSENYYSWTFKQGKDGLWYIELPGSEKISGY
ncbi:MAG TPA: hypothetical protein VGK67_37735 [Myxococcales bacterium]|jgi:hypothetical protein